MNVPLIRQIVVNGEVVSVVDPRELTAWMNLVTKHILDTNNPHATTLAQVNGGA